MDNLGTIITIILAAITIGLTYYIYKRNIKRKRLEFSTRKTSLLAAPANHNHDELTITYGDRQVSDPYVLDLEFASLTHKDISSDDFNAETPLKISIGTRIVAQMDFPLGQRCVFLDSTEIENGDSLVVHPRLFKKGNRYHLRLLTDGKPVPRIPRDDPLKDVDIVISARVLKRRRKIDRIFVRAVATLTSLAFLNLVTQSVIAAFMEPPTDTVWWIFARVPTEPGWMVIWYWIVIGLLFSSFGSVLLGLLRINRNDKKEKVLMEFYGYPPR